MADAPKPAPDSQPSGGAEAQRNDVAAHEPRLADSRGAEPPARVWSVRELVHVTAERFERARLDTPRTDAEALLAHVLGCDRMGLFLAFDRPIETHELDRYREAVRRRLTREPVAYIRGKRGFHGLNLELDVDARVLVPRPETELLVDWLLEDLPPRPAPRSVVLDVGTGSGAIALAIKHAREDIDVVACDTSPDALAVARANAARLSLDVRCTASDLLAEVEPPAQGFCAVAANLPYIDGDECQRLAPEVRFEPRLALDGGRGGLVLVERLLQQLSISRMLGPRGWVYLEVGFEQADRVLALLDQHGFTEASVRLDHAGIARIVRARLPACDDPHRP